MEVDMLGTSRKVQTDFDDAVGRIRDALQKEGFGVLTEIDVKKTLKNKLDVDFRKYLILGACNPPFAHRALTTDLEIGLLLPCNVVVYEDDGGDIVVSAVDAAVMATASGNRALSEIAAEVNEKLKRAVETF
jgi:uncharacterized protein (DUF302 family)